MILKKSLCLLVLAILLVACGSGGDATPTPRFIDAPTQSADSDTDDQSDNEPSNKSDSDDKITIKFAVNEFEMGSYTDLVATFEEENPDIDIRLVSSNDILELNAVGGGEFPDDAEDRMVRNADVINGGIVGFSADAVDRGLILDLTPLIDGDSSFNRSDYWPGLIPDNSAIAVVPTNMNFNLIFYDKDKFDAAGVDYPQAGWSWDEFRQVAQALKIASGDEVEQWGFIQPFLNPIPYVEGQLDRPIIDTTTDPPTARYEDDDVAQAVQWYIDLYQTDDLLPYFPQEDQDDIANFQPPEGFQLVEDGKAAMWEDFSGAFGFRAGGGDNIGVAPFPSNGDSASTPLFVDGIAISAGTANPNAAWRWVSFLSTQEQPDFGFGSRTQLPVRQSVAESSGFWDDVEPSLGEALRYGVTHGLQANATGYEELFTAVTEILDNDEALDVALAEAQQNAETSISDEDSAEVVESFSVVASREEEVASADATTITFVTLGSGFDLGQYRDIAAEFTAQNPDIVVEIRPPDFTADAGAIDLPVVAENADCFQWFSEIQDPDAQAAILPIDAFIDADADFDRDDFFPALAEQFTYQGQLWGIPASITPVIIEYNRNLFDAAGVDYPSPDWTLDQFTELAIAITEGDGEFKTYGFVPDAFENNILLLMLERRGASLIDNGQEPPNMTLNNAETAAALRWYADMHTQLGVKPAFITDPSDFASNQGAFADRDGIIDEGRAGMWTEFGLGGGGFGLGDRSSMNIGYAPIPSGDGGAGLTPADGYFISAETPNRRECWEWLKFVSASPDIVTGLPGRQSVAQSAEYRNSVGAEKADAYLASIETMGDAESTIFRLFSGDNDWMGVGTFWLGRAHQQVIDDEATVEEALDNAQLLFDSYRNCVIANDAFSDPDKQNDCLKEADPSLPSFLTGG